MRFRLLTRALPILAITVAACTAPAGSASPSAATSASPSASTAPSVAPEASASPAVSESPAGSADAGTVTITGIEYSFRDAPTTASVGTTFALANGGQELHEMLVVRKNPDTTESWDELIAMNEDIAFTKVTFVGAAMAEPGQTAADTVTVDEPGEYLMVCFIPVGMQTIPPGTPDPNESLAPAAPHHEMGMLHEFTVEG
jgi:plastocyanin